MVIVKPKEYNSHSAKFVILKNNVKYPNEQMGHVSSPFVRLSNFVYEEHTPLPFTMDWFEQNMRDVDEKIFLTELAGLGDVNIPKKEITVSFDEYMRESDHSLWATRIPLFYFKLNYMMHKPNTTLIGAIAVRKKFLRTPQDIRNMGVGLMQRPWDYNDGVQCSIPHAGWHFSYFGNENHVRNKIQSFAHRETNNDYILGNLNLDEMLKNKRGLDPNNYNEQFEYVEVDDYFPNTVVNNLEKYQSFIIDGATKNVLDFLPAE
jgi:hypothetical protein